MTIAAVSRAQWLEAARSWIGTPWRHQGRNRYGVDCIGLVLVTAWQLGISDYDVTGYGRSPDGDFMRREAERLMAPVDEARPGDVMVMRFSSMPQHVLIRTERGILHAWALAGRVVETQMPANWQRRIVGSFAVPGIV